MPGPWSQSLPCSRPPVGGARALPWPASKEDLGKPSGASSTGAFMQPPAMITQTLAHHPFTRSLLKAGSALLALEHSADAPPLPAPICPSYSCESLGKIVKLLEPQTPSL